MTRVILYDDNIFGMLIQAEVRMAADPALLA